MTQALILVHRDSAGGTTAHPFAYRDGNLLPVVEEIADYLAGMGLECALWEGIAADRLRTILENRQRIVALGEVIERQKAIIDYAKERIGLAEMNAVMEAAV